MLLMAGKKETSALILDHAKFWPVGTSRGWKFPI